MKKVLIIHGWDSIADEGWRGWLRKELTGRGMTVIAPQMPHAAKPILAEWLALMHSIVTQPSEEWMLIGHSLGTVAILRYLESVKDTAQIGAAILVSAFYDSLGIPELENFVSAPLQWERIKLAAKKFFLLNSDNDRYIPLSQAYELRDKLAAELRIEHNAGHFSSHEGYAELPILLDTVLAFNTDR